MHPGSKFSQRQLSLGPLLFLIYINDLHKVFNRCTIHHFADDTNLLFASKSTKTIETVVNYELKVLVDWLKANKLSLNEKKTEMVLFHSPFKKTSLNISIKLNNSRLERLHDVGYLGIQIDEYLSWKKQIQNVCVKLSRTNGILSILRHYAPKNVLLSIYYSLFYSYILYGCLVWQFSSEALIDRIFKLQKKCSRIITFSAYDAHTNPLFSSLEIIKVHDVFKYQTFKVVHDYYTGKLPQTLNKLFVKISQIHSLQTRSNKSDLLYLPKVKTTRYGINSIRYDASKLWNDEIKSCNSILETKSTFVLKKYFKTKFLDLYKCQTM